MTIHLEENDPGADVLVSSSGNTEARIRLDRHERDELVKIADEIREDDG